MKCLAALGLALVMASPSLSQTARVRGIELGETTRVAIEFPARPEWQVRRTAQGYAIRFPAGGVASVDVAGAFGANALRRVKAIRPTADGGLDIDLGCPCKARISEFRDTSIVIDIFEEASPPENGPVASSPHKLTVPPSLEMPTVSTELSAGPARLASPADPPPRRAALRTLPAAPRPEPLPAGPSPSSTLPQGLETAAADLAGLGFEPRDSLAIEMLSRELSRAIAQGLIDAPDLDRQVPAAVPDQPAPDRLDDGRSNLSITTAVDRDVRANRERPLPTMSGSVCLPDSEFDMNAWGDPKDRKTLGRLRTDAYDDKGQPSPSGMLNLIRYYLTMGFGAEARVLTAYLDDPAQRALLAAMSDIVDHGESNRSVLDGQVFCKGKAALWSLLAHDVPADEKPSDTDHILSAFSELPLHLRIHLGPILSERLQRLGFEAEAQIALNAVTRGGGHTPAQDLTAARLGLSGTTPETARDDLEDLARGTDLIAAEALLELLLDAERRGIPPEPAWVADGPSLVRATQGTDTAAELNLAGFRGHIALGQFDVLREALNETSPGLTEEARGALATSAIGAAGEVADDPAFLRAEVAFSKIAEPAAIPEPRRLRVAERLIELGLFDRAMKYLSDTPVAQREALLRSAALGGLSRLTEAIATLSEMDSPEALRALGDLYLRADRPGDAIAAFARASEVERASLAAIGNADWDWLQTHPDAALSSAVRDLAEDPVATSAAQPGNVALLERAAQRRRHADTLLRQTALGAGADAFTN